MAPSRRSSRTTRTTSTRRMPTKSTKSVTFDLETEQDLLTEIESYLSESEFSSFSDFCKHVVQQYMHPAPAPDSRNGHSEMTRNSTDPTSDSPDLAQLQQQISALEERLHAVSSDQSRLDKLESDLGQLAARLDQITDHPHQAEDKAQSKSRQEAPEDPLLARLGSLLEDF